MGWGCSIACSSSALINGRELTLIKMALRCTQAVTATQPWPRKIVVTAIGLNAIWLTFSKQYMQNVVT